MSDAHDTPRNPGHPRQAGEKSRAAILNFLREIKSSGDPSPTLDEIADATVLSKSTVHQHLRWLAERDIVAIGELRREIRLLVDEVPDAPLEKRKRGRPRTRPLTVRESIVAAIVALESVAGERVPVTLLALTARILNAEAAHIAREVAAMVAEGALTQMDGGYLSVVQA